MQDYLREIEGTLSRTNERKGTLLYKLAKRKAEEERLSRLGVSSIPSNPLEVTDVNVVKYALFRLKQEIGDKIAQMRNTQLLSIETHGEVVIRAKNDDINNIITKKNLWEKRLAFLSGKDYKMPHSKKIYFGCAKGLVEAQKATTQNSKEVTEDNLDELESNSISSEFSGDEGPQSSNEYLERLAAFDSEGSLRDVEMAAERKLRLEFAQEDGGAPFKRARNDDTDDYIVDIQLPSEEEFHRKIIDAKKEMLQKRLESLKR
ncbi:pre-mRNA-splicing factor ISY1 [Trypanosoma theileri]|uniref:Pre-mRNA-splicing factor ISY1 n=1 Tax=Trypanosoma theileri TaxID=67003 RepID=A0A1X0NL28_9TRYP|nr:pre-mRNA-splicing factor ISY1 [Trypanosoma theileri]ORC85153.1 pre-mRNA-splicing factor ISY1 [Trypanosoma theileri]